MVNKIRHNLTSKQIKAINLLARGKSAMEVSRQLKMHRETLRCWKKNPEFIMEFERVIREIRDDLNYRLVHLVDSSISKVIYGIENSHCDNDQIKIALNVLKLLGIERQLIPGEVKTPLNVDESLLIEQCDLITPL